MKKKYKWGTGFIAKKDADKDLRKMLSAYDNDEIVFGISESFKDVYEQRKKLIAPELYKSRQTFVSNTGYINNHILPLLGHIRSDKITTQHIQRLFFQMHKADDSQLSAATKKKILGILNSIFSNAKKWGLVSSNPCADIELKAPRQEEIEVWNLEQLYYFLNLDFVEESKYYLPFLILATTGMRRGEVYGLRWNDYDGVSLTLRRSMDIFNKETEMKTKGSHRRIDLMSNIISAIENKKKRWRYFLRH